MKFSPRPYQISAAKFLLTKPKSILYLDLGLGKTVVSLSFFQHLIHQKQITKVLVVTPLRPAYLVWPDEIEKWDHLNLSYTILHGSSKDERLKEDKDIYIINYEGLRWLYLNYRRNGFPYDGIIIDESSYAKNPKSKRFAYLRLIVRYTKYRTLLTGSISPNSLLDIWTQYYLLDNGKRLETSYGDFQKKYFTPIDYEQRNWVLKSKMLPVIANRVKDLTLRMKNEDYLTLPDKFITNLYCEMPNQLYHQYTTLEREFFIELESAEIEAFSAGTLSMKLRQFLAGCIYTNDGEKVNLVHQEKIKVLKEIKEAYNNPILAAIQFRFEYDLILKVFPNTPVIYGGISAMESVKLIEKWNKGKIPLLVVHPQSIAHGLNMQAGGSYILWMNLPWSADQYKQLNGRLYRSGQIKPVTISRILFKNTLDEVVSKTIERKMNNEETFAQNFIHELKEYKQ